MYHACLRRVHRQTSHQGLRFQLAREVQPHLLCQAAAESQLYAILYKDGLLSLQAGSGTDPSHGEVLGKWAWDGSSNPWHDKRASVSSVVARDKVAVSNGYEMFRDLANCESMDLSKLDVSRATSFSFMFDGCSRLQSLDLSDWDVSSATVLAYMFNDCPRLQSLDVSRWDVSSVTDFSGMLNDCSCLESLDVSGWDVSSAVDLSGMFWRCSGLQSLDLSGWDVSNALDFSLMFYGCSRLQSLDLSGWDVSDASSLSCMFDGCTFLSTVTLSAGCGPLVGGLPGGTWYDAEGEQYDRLPIGVAGTFTRTKPAVQTAMAGDAPAQDAGVAVPVESSAPERPVELDVPAVEPGNSLEHEQPAGSSDSAVSPEPDTANAPEGADNLLPGSSDDPNAEHASDESESDAGVLTGEEPLALAA